MKANKSIIMQKVVIFLGLLINALAHPEQRSKYFVGLEMNQTNDFEIFNLANQNENSTLTTTSSECKCLPFHMCANAASQIDIRSFTFEDTCSSYLEICCSPNSIIPDSSIKFIEPNNVSLVASNCGTRNENGIRFNIIGNNNNEAQFAEFPWHVAIFKEIRSSNGDISNTYACGGSLINQSVILTAAHCLYQKGTPLLNVQMWKVRAGEWDLNTTFEPYSHQDRAVRKIVIHPHFRRSGVLNDIALLFLTQPFELGPHINSICLPNPDLVFDQRSCFATGWGKDSFDDEANFQHILKRIELPIVARELCVQRLRETRLGLNFELHPSFICAGKPGHDTCTGDGGSPLICQIRNAPGRYAQAGIVSWGIKCGDPRVPGVYVNVSMFWDWVHDEMKLNDLSTKS
ncbi:phenoloxidase-activating factor 2-like isoform X2 [Contarinia nasturtii]|uniref:phenoloxidase-activating factor 2-like isoform X2 n=1 Tax=Contarinia nasturtii TaxID=265458 RepID=UPI0012D39126|nr:phenoloxidase-activating factor 2-like isoform X2 [Contarinia nasturtii]